MVLAVILVNVRLLENKAHLIATLQAMQKGNPRTDEPGTLVSVSLQWLEIGSRGGRGCRGVQGITGTKVRRNPIPEEEWIVMDLLLSVHILAGVSVGVVTPIVRNEAS